MSATLISPEKHVVKETPASRLFRRLLKFDDIFTFYSVETGQWILAYWANRGGRLAEEIEDLGSCMELVSPELVQMIQRGWGHCDWKAVKRRVNKSLAAHSTRMDENIIQHQERWDWAKKRTQNKAPIPYGFYGSLSGGS